MNNRERIQYEGTKAWVEGNKRGTLVLVTGLGKSKIGCDIAGKQLQNGLINSVLVVVPTTNLMQQWYDEFNKWGYDATKIDFLCIQSAHKREMEYDLVIVDEIHTTLSEKYSKIYQNIKYSQLLGLTATKPEDPINLEFLNSVCPIVYEKTIKEVDALGGIVSPVHTYNLAIKLNRKEKARYNVFNEQFYRATMELGRLKKDIPELKNIAIFDIAKEYSRKPKNSNDTATEKELRKYSKDYWAAMTMRKQQCYNAESKIPIVKAILEKFPNKKWILFNKSIKFAELLKSKIEGSEVYHSKLKDEDRERILKEFGENKFKYLICVDALNAGFNVPDVDSAICISGVSKELVAIQTRGRVSRFMKDKEATFINLYSETTVEKSWVTTKTKNIPNVRWIETLHQITPW